MEHVNYFSDLYQVEKSFEHGQWNSEMTSLPDKDNAALFMDKERVHWGGKSTRAACGSGEFSQCLFEMQFTSSSETVINSFVFVTYHSFICSI